MTSLILLYLEADLYALYHRVLVNGVGVGAAPLGQEDVLSVTGRRSVQDI